MLLRNGKKNARGKHTTVNHRTIHATNAFTSIEKQLIHIKTQTSYEES